MSKQQINVDVNLRTAISGIDSAVGKLQNGLKNVKLDFNSSGGKTLLKDIQRLQDEYKNFQSLTSNSGGKIDIVDIKALEKSSNKIRDYFRRIISQIGGIDNMDLDLAKKLFPDSFDKKAKDKIRIIEDYERALEKQAQIAEKIRKTQAALDAKQAKVTKTEQMGYAPTGIGDAEKEARAAKAAVQDFYKTLAAPPIKGFDGAAKTIGEVEAVLKDTKDEAKSLEKELAAAGVSFSKTGTAKLQKQLNAGEFGDQAGKIEQLIELRQQIELYSQAVKSAKDSVSKIGSSDTSSFSKEQIEQYNTYVKQLEEAENKLKSLRESEAKGSFSTPEQLEKAKKEIEELTEEINKYKAEMAEITSVNLNTTKAELEKLGEEFKELGNSPEEFLAKLKELKEKLNLTDQAGLAKIKEALIEAGFGAEQAQNYVDNLNEGLRATGAAAKEISQAEKEMQNLTEQVKQFFSITNAIQVFKRVVNDALNTVKELDAAMAEIAVVSDFSVGDMWEKLPEFTDQANELGVAIKDVYSATTLYVQQGLDLNASMELSNETLKMARIAGMDAAAATDAMTAALRGFNMELGQTSGQRIADVYSELAA